MDEKLNLIWEAIEDFQEDTDSQDLYDRLKNVERILVGKE